MSAHVLFDVRGARYALPAEAVESVFWLPALSPAEDLPPYYAGLFDLHGEVVAVIDLGQRFGHPASGFRQDQSVLMVGDGARRVGLIVDEAVDLIDLPAANIGPWVDAQAAHPAGAKPVIAGSVRWQEAVLTLLDPELLLSYARLTDAGLAPPATIAERVAGLAPDARELLLHRARLLAEPAASPDDDGRRYAIVGIDGERFAIAVEQIREFARFADCTPVPGCPPHVLGCMNLRGSVLPVLDLAHPLLGHSSGEHHHVLVVDAGHNNFGVAIHEVHDIRSFAPQRTLAIDVRSWAHPHCEAVLELDGAVAGILDLRALFEQGFFDVDATT